MGDGVKTIVSAASELTVESPEMDAAMVKIEDDIIKAEGGPPRKKEYLSSFKIVRRKKEKIEGGSPHNVDTPSRESSGITCPKMEDRQGPETAADDEEAKLKSRQQSSTPKPPATMALDAVEATEEATKTFEVIEESIYINKRIGDSDQDGEIMTCECREEWDGKINQACGEDSDCINRATRMECMLDDCGCGQDCQNMRFQRRQYADVSVIKADKKGFGLRAKANLVANQFIYEYVGEVIDEIRFRRRMEAYDKQGIKHFYFMSLKSGEFIDATKKGGLGRFCNHSCNPNCYVDKWVVGDKLRMGIFAKRDVQKGEELVFDYNVDRYGADPQPCYCGEPNCVGFIGGKTQTDAAPRLSHHVIEALGLEDDEVLVGKKGRKPRKTGEDDGDYAESLPAKQLGEKDVTKVMSTLLHCKERWIIHKLLSRIHNSTEEAVFPRVVRLHGYQILGRILAEYKHDDAMVLMALGIMMKFPRMTKNKITSSKIEPTVQELAKSKNETVRTESAALLVVWSELQTAFRIPRRVGAGPVENVYNDRQRNSRSHSNSPKAPAPPTAPKGFNQPPPRRPGGTPFKSVRDLPWGWHEARTTVNGSVKIYYYANDGRVSWWKPTLDCPDETRRKHPPPPPPIEYLELEREPLPENIAAMQKAKEDREFMRYLEQQMEEREKQQEERRKARVAKEEEEARLREEKEKEEKKERAKARAEYERNKRKEKLEQALTKTLTAICGKYVVRYQDGLGGKVEFKKWNQKIVAILVEKSMKQQSSNADIKKVCKKLYERNSLDKIKAFCTDHCEKVVNYYKKNPKKFLSATSSSASADTPTSRISPLAADTPPTVGSDDNSQKSPRLTISPKRKRDDDGDSPVDSPKRQKPETQSPSPGSRKRSRIQEGDDSELDAASPKRRKSPAVDMDMNNVKVNGVSVH